MAEQDKSDNVEANAKADADGSTMDRIKTGAFERNVALTRMGVGAGAKIASHTVRNFFRRGDSKDEANRNFYRAQAKELADELGRLKGSVMKAGQMLSLYGQYFLPEEAVEVLATLQDNTPAVSWSFVEPQLIDALGEKTIAKLDIQRKPIAAASLGQAHLATIKATGEQVVVKIQYPGVANAIDTDIRTLSRLISATRLAPKALDLTDVFNELRDMLVRECDYVQEREFTETFYDRLADNPRFIVPKVYPEFCAQRVLTTRYEPGYSVSSKEVQALSQKRRNALAQSFATANGTSNGTPVSVVYNDSVGGAKSWQFAVSPSTGVADFGLDNALCQRALVTGASSGIGEASANSLLAAGYTVYGTSRRGAQAGQLQFLRRFAPASVLDNGIRKSLQLDTHEDSV